MEPFANAKAGVGHEKGVADALTCTPHRKIRVQFRECKHTLLMPFD